MIPALLTLRLLALAATGGPDDVYVAQAQAEVESRLDVHAVSCPSSQPGQDYADASGATPRHPCFCGPWQGEAPTPAACALLALPAAAAVERHQEMNAWLRFCRGDLECALAGYGSGVAVARSGSSSYARRVLRRAAQLRRRAGA